jgi:hypothetical protein
LVAELDSITVGHGGSFVNSVNHIIGMFPSNIDEVIHSTSIIISKTNVNHIIDEKLTEKIQSMMNEKN